MRAPHAVQNQELRRGDFNIGNVVAVAVEGRHPYGGAPLSAPR
ncbi:hypothetical protein PJN29_24145 [Mycobacterium kansasii]